MAVQQRAATTRQKLVDAAVRQFAKKGYLETTPKHVADAAGLTTGAFYYHFKSKEELAAEIIDQSWPKPEHALASYMDPAGSGIEHLVDTEFTAAAQMDGDTIQRIGLDLRMAIGHLGAPARRTCQERVDAFALLVAAAFRESDLREGVTRKQAGELLWIATNGAQMMSRALKDTGPALFDRLGMAWKSALRSIVRDDMLPRLEGFVDETAKRYARAEVADSANGRGRVA